MGRWSELGQAAARWAVGQPVRLDREIGQRLDGKVLETSERKAALSMEKEHLAGTHPGLR